MCVWTLQVTRKNVELLRLLDTKAYESNHSSRLWVLGPGRV